MRTKDLQEGALAQQVYQQAELNWWPGLGREVKLICQEIQIQDMNIYKISKKGNPKCHVSRILQRDDDKVSRIKETSQN